MIRIRHYLDNRLFWSKLRNFAWVAGALGLAYLFVQISDIRADQTRETAIRVAVADARYQRCLEGRPLLTRVNTYLAGVRGLATVLLKNSEALLAETDADHPMRKVRLENYRTLKRAVSSITALDGFPVTTAEECEAEHRRATEGNA